MDWTHAVASATVIDSVFFKGKGRRDTDLLLLRSRDPACLVTNVWKRDSGIASPLGNLTRRHAMNCLLG